VVTFTLSASWPIVSGKGGKGTTVPPFDIWITLPDGTLGEHYQGPDPVDPDAPFTYSFTMPKEPASIEFRLTEGTGG
jgi:hypothetical protein